MPQRNRTQKAEGLRVDIGVRRHHQAAFFSFADFMVVKSATWPLLWCTAITAHVKHQ